MYVIEIGGLLVAAGGLVLAGYKTFAERVVRVRISCRPHMYEQQLLGLEIKVVNAGTPPIFIDKVFAARVNERRAEWTELPQHFAGYQPTPIRLASGEATTLIAATKALHHAAVRQQFTVIVETQEGRRFQCPCAVLRQLHAKP